MFLVRHLFIFDFRFYSSMRKQDNAAHRIALDFVLLLVVGLPIIAVYKSFSPYRRGFFCDDDSIRYPYKLQTISSAALYSVGILIPVLIFALTEFIRHRYDAVRMDLGESRDVPQGAWRSYKVIIWFMIGVCVNELITGIPKNIIGRLRPHFLDVCKPDVDCATIPDQHAYVSNYTCTGDVLYMIIDGRRSFPSGHSSVSWYTMLFTVIYLQHRMTYCAFRQFRPLLQFLLLLVATCTSLSRISDNMHHWSDVLAGSVLGAAEACALAFWISDVFTTDVLNTVDDGEPDMKKVRYSFNLGDMPGILKKGSHTNETVVTDG